VEREPVGKHQVNRITTFTSGTPFTVYDSRDVTFQGGAPEMSGFSSGRPNLVGDPNAGPQTSAQCFNVSAFQRLDPVLNAGQFGNAGRNIVEGPTFTPGDFSASKNIQLSESKSLQLRGEFFNLFNRANYGLPDNDLNSPTAGKILSAAPPRLVQVALKFLF
jgi:hypothetical protein